MDESKTPSELIRVEIFGQSYNVRGEEEKAYLEELARFVDTKMKHISETTATSDSLKVAILAALNIADELFKLERTQKAANGRLAAKLADWNRSLDETLKQA
jgi:cell division protein ZapA